MSSEIHGFQQLGRAIFDHFDAHRFGNDEQRPRGQRSEHSRRSRFAHLELFGSDAEQVATRPTHAGPSETRDRSRSRVGVVETPAEGSRRGGIRRRLSRSRKRR